LEDFIAFNDLHYFKFVYFIRHFGLINFDELFENEIYREEG